MERRFVFGVGRSGTRLLSRLMALSPSPLKFALEPLARVRPERYPPGRRAEAWFVPPEPASPEFAQARAALASLEDSDEVLREELRAVTVERNDRGAEILLVKEVHGLLAFPELMDAEDRAVLITRDTLRVMDSYFYGYTPKQRTYLIDEHKYLRRALRRNTVPGGGILAAALERAPATLRAYLQRPRWRTTELFRQACMTELMRLFLLAWPEADARVTHLRFEELCVNPVAESLRAFDFLGLACDEDTMSKVKETTSRKGEADYETDRHGPDSEYYATQKNSRQILSQPFKVLKERDLEGLRALLGLEG